MPLESLAKHCDIDIAVSSVTGGRSLCVESTCRAWGSEWGSSDFWTWLSDCRPTYRTTNGAVQSEGAGI